MKQLGQSTVKIIVEFLQKDVFGNAEKDLLLQKAIAPGPSLTEFDKSSIAGAYTDKTTSIINTDLDFREVFWKEFFAWLDLQKQLTSEPFVLAKRLLPVNPEGGYYDEATRNFNKFAFQSIKAFEFSIIEKQIDKKHGKGTDKAKSEKKKLKNGDLILIKNKNGEFEYYEHREVRVALESVKKSAELLQKLKTEETERGLCAISFNPLQLPGKGEPEAKSTVLDLNKEVWANKAAIMQKHLEKTGIYVDGPLRVENGVIVGTVVDKKGVKLEIEVSVVKPGERVYTFTFKDRGTQHFSLHEDQLQDHFVNKKRNALEVYTLVQKDKEAQRGAPMPVGRFVKKPGEKAEAPVAKREAEEEKKKSEVLKKQLDTKEPVEPPAQYIKSVQLATEAKIPGQPVGGQLESLTASPPKGPMLAKQEFDAKFIKQKEKVKGGRFIPQNDSEVADLNKQIGSKGASKKNPALQVAKWYGIAGAGLGGAITGITLFT